MGKGGTCYLSFSPCFVLEAIQSSNYDTFLKYSRKSQISKQDVGHMPVIPYREDQKAASLGM